nr:MAG TPA: hypothetical protein [Bacteriophage sp.]
MSPFIVPPVRGRYLSASAFVAIAACKLLSASVALVTSFKRADASAFSVIA